MHSKTHCPCSDEFRSSQALNHVYQLLRGKLTHDLWVGIGEYECQYWGYQNDENENISQPNILWNHLL